MKVSALGMCFSVVLMLSASSAFGSCGKGQVCDVGAAGQGGISSGGKAQGFRSVGPGNDPTSTATNSGNDDAGRLLIERQDGSGGSLSGTFRNDIARGQGTGTGDFESFGDWHGLCPLEEFPC